MLVVDDHVGFRHGVRALLEADGFVVVGEATDGAGALAEAARLRPDVVLLDIGLPDIDGLALIDSIRELARNAVIVAVSARREAEYGGRVGRARPDAFLDKRSIAPGVLSALLEAAAR